MLVAASPVGAQEPTVPLGVTVSGVDVGGLTEVQATEALDAFFGQRLTLALRQTTVTVAPSRLGARARVARAVDQALLAAPGTALTLDVAIVDWRLKAWINKRARIFDRAAVSARAYLVGLRPHLREARPGRSIVRPHARIRLLGALRNHRRDTVVIPVRTLRPAITANRFGAAFVIRRGSKRLTL